MNSGLTARQRRALVQAKRFAASLPGIRGVDFGYMYRNGRRTRTKSIRFHVEHKKPPSDLGARDSVPEKIDGIPCDVIEASYMPHAMVNPRGYVEPIRPGVSVGNLLRKTAGTLGALVMDKHNGTVAVLSNWHVLAASLDAISGEEIVQPATYFLGPNPARTVGLLSRWLDLDNGYDAAIATLVDKITTALEVANVDLTIQGMAEPRNGMRLVKSAAMTQNTNALVDGVEGSYLINYTRYGAGTRWMKGIRLVPDPDAPFDEISLSGDSGAIWIDRETRNAVALLFAGEDNLTPLYEYALAQPLGPIFDLLDIELVIDEFGS